MDGKSKWTLLDLSQRLDAETPPFPGDPPVELRALRVQDLPAAPGRSRIECTQLTANVHCGTHMDAPFHFFEDGRTVDRIALEVCIGPATLARVRGVVNGVIEAEHLAPLEASLRETGRVVLDTGWACHWGKEDYFTAHPVLSGGAARFLADCGVRLVGVDTPSVDRDPYEAHLALLSSGAVILENLTNLDAIPGGQFELVAAPLKITGRDGSPVRAVAIIEEEAP